MGRRGPRPASGYVGSQLDHLTVFDVGYDADRPGRLTVLLRCDKCGLLEKTGVEVLRKDGHKTVHATCRKRWQWQQATAQARQKEQEERERKKKSIKQRRALTLYLSSPSTPKSSSSS